MKYRTHLLISLHIFLHSTIFVNSTPENYIVNNYGMMINNCEDYVEIVVENSTTIDDTDVKSMNEKRSNDRNFQGSQIDFLRNLFADGDEESWESYMKIFNQTYGYSIANSQNVWSTRSDNEIMSVEICEKINDLIVESFKTRIDLIDDLMNDPCAKAANSLKLWIINGLFPSQRKGRAVADKKKWEEILDVFERVLGQPLDENLKNVAIRSSISPDLYTAICDKITEIFSKDEQDLQNHLSTNDDSCEHAKTVFIVSVIHNLIPPSEGTIENETGLIKYIQNLFSGGDDGLMNRLGDIFKRMYGSSMKVEKKSIRRSDNREFNSEVCYDIFDMFFEDLNIENNGDSLRNVTDETCLKAADTFKSWIKQKTRSNESYNSKPIYKTRIFESWNMVMNLLKNMIGLPIDHHLKNMGATSSLRAFDSCEKITDLLSKRIDSPEKAYFNMTDEDPCLNAVNIFIVWILNELMPKSTAHERMGKSLFIESKDDTNPYRIVGGYDTQITDFPFIVSYGKGCGGAILNKYWILTAAHCGSRDKLINVGSTKHLQGKTYLIAKHMVHSRYNDYTVDYDFQLLKLEKPLEFSSAVQPIKIGSSNDILPGKNVTVLGWGRTAENSRQSEVLQAVDVPVTTDEFCKKSMMITKNMFCAGLPTGKKDACQGDSGGPVVRNNRLIGVVSFGVGCGRAGYPGVYAKVPMVVDWINEHIN